MLAGRETARRGIISTEMRKNRMKRNRAVNALMVLTVALTLLSCNRKTVYYRFSHTPVEGWERNDTLTFDVRPMAEAGDYRQEIGLRIDSHYPFMGLSLIVDQTVLPSGFTVSDTLNCNLIAADGTVKGRGLSIYQYKYHLKNIRLDSGDSLHICVRHDMVREVMPGIVDVGVRIDRIE